MTTTELTDRLPEANELSTEPLMEVCVDLAVGMQVRMDCCVGDVPMVEITAGRARLIFSFDVGDVRLLGAEHVALAEEFATAACALRDEVGQLMAGR